MSKNLIDKINNLNKVSLSHQVHSDIPRFEAFDRLSIKEVANIEDHGFWGNEITIGSQYGTHIDAPNHFSKGRRKLLDIKFEERILPLYVIDISKKVCDNEDYEVSLEDIEDFEKEHGKIAEKSFVALRSDWSKRFSDPLAFVNKGSDGIEHTPGWSLEVLKFLNEKRNVTAIGHETLNTDSGVAFDKNKALEGEFYWLDSDKYQVELLNNLDKLPATGALIIISFSQIKDISGFNCEVNALFE